MQGGRLINVGKMLFEQRGFYARIHSTNIHLLCSRFGRGDAVDKWRAGVSRAASELRGNTSKGLT